MIRFRHDGNAYEVDVEFYVHYKARQIRLPNGRYILPMTWTENKEPRDIVEITDRARQSGIYAMEAKEV